MKLNLKKRKIIGKKVKNLRKEKHIPASMYGPVHDSINVSVDLREFIKVFENAGYNKLIDIDIEGKEEGVKALVKEVQYDHIRDLPIHLSLYAVDMKKKINVDVPVVIEGIAPAVKLNIGLLVVPSYSVVVHCLPGDIPDQITINVGGLAEIGDSIKIGDIQLPEGVEWLNELDMKAPIVFIAPPQKQVEVEEEEEKEDEGQEGAAEGEAGEGEAAEGDKKEAGAEA